MSDPMPEAVEAAWLVVEERKRLAITNQSITEMVAAAEPIIRADERAKVLAPILALADEWERSTLPVPSLFAQHAAQRLRAAIGATP